MTRAEEYAIYLRSERWRELRETALERDGGKCRACDGPAQHVHHARYPSQLGREKLGWLYSLCAPCHEAIHLLEGSTLRDATNAILSRERGAKIIRLAEDWQLSPEESRRRQFRQGGRHRVRTLKGQGEKKNPPKFSKRLHDGNEELHQWQAENRKKREARRAS